MKQRIESILSAVVHPETGRNIVESGLVDSLSADGEKITLTLCFPKSRDPFAAKIRQQVQDLLEKEYPSHKITVVIRESAPRTPRQEKRTTTGGIAHVVAIASGKGGVGKSTVTANLAIALRDRGFRVGILDADIYGPSQPGMFGVEGYVPDAVERDGETLMVPAESMGIKLMSIGFFIRPTDALMWRGAMATNALKQMIHQTEWGALDFLLADLPPGTGDIHLSIISELKLSAAVIVSTPQRVAVADVVRGVEMFRHPQVSVPVAGIVENMAWFSPEELPGSRYYIFGHGGARRYAEENGLDLLGEIPVVQSIMEGSDNGEPASAIDPRVSEHYLGIADKVVEKVMKGC